jgi:hypothetical protein
VAIEIREGPEPRSEAARTTPPLLVSCDAAEVLQHELRRYCNREINGRSFLIAGHRGAGKTTLVENAWLTLWRESEEGKTRLRPLFVQLHGPSLFKTAIHEVPKAPTVDPKASDASGKPKTGSSAGAPPTAARSAGGAPPSAAGQQAQTPAAGKPGGSQPNPEGSSAPPSPTSELQTVLEQITLALHRAVSQEFARDMWLGRRDPLPSPGPSGSAAQRGGRPRDADELAAQFEAELYQSPEASRLRLLYERANAIPHGVLRRRGWQPLLPREQGAQGWRELVALTGICDAYRRLSAKVEQSDQRTDEGQRQAKQEGGIDSAKADLLTPLYALLAGGLAGVGTGAAAQSWFAGATTGLVAALGSALVFKTSWSRSRSATRVRQQNIIFDLSPATLDRVLPIFVARLLEAGLAPIFVVDELDKVDDLDIKMREMVHHLKKLVAESTFFCFLADREYFEKMVRNRRQTAYAVEYTYFTHDLFVVFSPARLHAHLENVLQVQRAPASQRGQDDVDREVLPYVLLHRSRMHAIDLRRQLSRWRTEAGTVDVAPGEIVTDAKFRLDVLIQLAIEVTLDGDRFRERIANDPEMLRLAYDAMYYITRRWIRARNEEREGDGGLVLDDSDAAGQEFSRYLAWRVKSDTGQKSNNEGKQQEPSPPKGRAKGAESKSAAKTADTGNADDLAPPPQTVRFLYDRTRELAELLAHPESLATAVTKWNKSRASGRAGEPRPPVAKEVLNAVGLDYGEAAPPTPGAAASVEAPVTVLSERFYLLDRAEGPNAPQRYTWRYEPDGGELFTRAAPPAGKGAVLAPKGAARESWRADVKNIREVEAMIRRLVLEASSNAAA